MNQDKIPDFRLESELEAYCVKYAGLYGIVSYKFVSPGKRGVPDRLFIIPGGETIYVEFKHPNGLGRLSALQIQRAKEISENGASVYACDTFEEFRGILSRHTSTPAELV